MKNSEYLSLQGRISVARSKLELKSIFKILATLPASTDRQALINAWTQKYALVPENI